MILYLREKNTEKKCYYQLDAISVSKDGIDFAVRGKSIYVPSKEIEFASLRTEDGRLLQIIKE